jgi:hypothetical protein
MSALWPLAWLAQWVANKEEPRFKEVDLKFAIRRCHIGDEASLSLLGKETFLETYAACTQAADLLTFVETEQNRDSTAASG